MSLAVSQPATSANATSQSGKLVVIVEENEPYGNIVGNSQAPYLNQLIANGKLFTSYTAVASGSTPDYLAMTSGLTTSLSPPSPNIFQAIDGTAGTLTWKEFMESMPGNCAQGTYANIPGTNVPLYTASHDPDYQYRASTSCSTNDVPMTTSSFNPASLPGLSYIVPNQCDDMHTLPGSGQACPAYFGSNSGSSVINMGDNWLASVVPSLLAQPGVTVVITWDEGNGQTTPPQQVVALEAGAGVTPGSTDGTAINHYGLEAGLYNYFGLGTAPNNGATATPLPIPSPAPPPAPTISSVTPASGWPGTSVTLSGTGFTGTTAVSFNGAAATFNVSSDSQLSATVPVGAASGPISVTTAGGTASSTASFTVTSEPAPSITGVSPASATVGSSVTISGSGFTGATAVSFNNTAATFSAASDSTITATVPSGALTGSITVTTPAGSAPSPTAFGVIPTVSSFTPTSGKAGTSVTIAGNAFTGATTVAFNGTSAVFTADSYTRITATVPTGATAGPISVTTAGGTGVSTASFAVTSQFPPTITGVSPASATVGSSITISGTAFTGATAVTFNNTAAAFTVVSDTSITATVPSGALTGTITVTTPAGSGSSPATFGVIPTVSSFSPNSGKAGTTVTITGSAFTGATTVTFNGTPAVFTVNSYTQITVTVPGGATSGRIAVTTAGGTGTSSSLFNVRKNHSA
ncbi:MAG TPA: IPT/TIG domain-containing protein [Candidatus Dormibacteraeota bacterium]